MTDAGRARDPAQGYARVASSVVGDLARGATAAAEALLPGGGPGASRTTQARAVQHLRDAWPYPEERAKVFARMVPVTPGPDGKTYPARNGLAYWENLVAAAFPYGYPPVPPFAPVPPPAPPEGPQNGFVPPPPVPAPLAGAQTGAGPPAVPY